MADKLILIPRIYTNKPRTTGEGYKGIPASAGPEKKPDLLHGLIAIRKMHMRAIEESGLTAADEMLYRKPGDIWMIFFLMLLSEHVLWKISSIVWWQAVWMFRWV